MFISILLVFNNSLLIYLKKKKKAIKTSPYNIPFGMPYLRQSFERLLYFYPVIETGLNILFLDNTTTIFIFQE